MTNSFLSPDRVAVITGAASGIGLATSKRFAQMGMRVCMADINAAELSIAEGVVASLAPAGSASIMSVVTNVGELDSIEALKVAVYDKFGEVAVLMNNAATRVVGGDREDLDEWRRTMDINFWNAVYAERVFLPAMQDQGTPCAIINTGSKQGITNPPGNLIYNITKSALKSYSEGLQHQLRNTEGCQISVHLLVPGWTTTGKREHKQGAWLPDQLVDYMIKALENGDFYIICPDDDVSSEMDHQRMLWAAGDMIENRPPLSRWHPDWADKFNQS